MSGQTQAIVDLDSISCSAASFISSIRVQWVMVKCVETSSWSPSLPSHIYVDIDISVVGVSWGLRYKSRLLNIACRLVEMGGLPSFAPSEMDSDYPKSCDWVLESELFNLDLDGVELTNAFNAERLLIIMFVETTTHTLALPDARNGRPWWVMRIKN